MTPTVKSTLPQPGLQRRWNALDGEDVSDGGDPYTGYYCPLPLVDDLRDGFACNEPLIAAKQCFGRTQRSLWLKDTGTELQPLVDIAWGYNALPRQRHRWVGLRRRRRRHSAWPERSEGNQASLRTWRRDRSPGAPEEHQDQLGDDHWRSVEERLGTSTDPERQHVWNPQDRWDLILRDRDTTSNGTLDEHLWCLKDDLDPIAIADHTGNIVERYAFSAFGMTSILTPTFEPRSGNQSDFDWNLLFHAEFADHVTGWMNYHRGHYSPQLGRWTSRDPIDEARGVNLYGVVGNEPLEYVDDLGESRRRPRDPRPGGAGGRNTPSPIPRHDRSKRLRDRLDELEDDYNAKRDFVDELLNLTLLGAGFTLSIALGMARSRCDAAYVEALIDESQNPFCPACCVVSVIGHHAPAGSKFRLENAHLAKNVSCEVVIEQMERQGGVDPALHALERRDRQFYEF